MKKAKQQEELDNAFKALNITPQPDKKLVMPILSENERRLLETKEWSKGLSKFFESKKDISIKEVADKLLAVLDYSIDIKDSQAVATVSRDIAILFRLTK